MKYIKCFKDFKMKALTFSFDDGTYQDLEMINMMKLFHLKGTFNLNSGLMNDNGDYIICDWLQNKRIIESQINEIYDGFEIASHCLTHADLTQLTNEQIVKEIKEDITNLKRITNNNIEGFAYPYGHYNDFVIKTLKENGILYARTVDSDATFNLPKDNYQYGGTCTISYPMNKLIQKFNKMKPASMKLFYIWGHSYELDMFHEHEIVYKELEQLANKEDVWYCTNQEVFNYLNAMKKLRYNHSLKQFSNPTSVDLYVIADGKPLMIKGEK